VEGRGDVPSLAASAGLGNPLQPRLEPVRRLEISPRQCECDRPSMRRLMEPFWAWWSSLWSCSVCGGYSWVSGGAPPSARTAAPLAHVRTPTNIAWRAVRRPSDITTDRTPWCQHLRCNLRPWTSCQSRISLGSASSEGTMLTTSFVAARLRAVECDRGQWPTAHACSGASRTMPASIPHAGRRTQSGRVSAFTSTLAIATSTAVADVPS
jgi:hypothetical protein